MRKTALIYYFMTVLCFLLGIFSCKKTNIIDYDVQLQQVAKEWQQSQKAEPFAIVTAINNLVGHLDYSDGSAVIEADNSTTYYIKISNPENYNKYLALQKKGNDFISSRIIEATNLGEIISFGRSHKLPTYDSLRFTDLLGAHLYTLIQKSRFELAVRIRLPNSKYGITNGKITDGKSPQKNYKLNYVREEAPPVCIEWYDILYDIDTNQVYEETYLYTTCENNGGGTYDNGNGNDGPKACLKSFYFQLQGDNSNTNRAMVWGIPAEYPNYGLSVTFGLDVYAPNHIINWNWLNNLDSQIKFRSLWSDGDIVESSSGGYDFSKYAQQKILAAAVDWASYTTASYVELETANTPSTYKAVFKVKLETFLSKYFPGASFHILHDNEPGTTPFQTTYGNTGACN